MMDDEEQKPIEQLEGEGDEKVEVTLSDFLFDPKTGKAIHYMRLPGGYEAERIRKM